MTLADVTQFRDLGRFQPWNIVSLREVLAANSDRASRFPPVLIIWWSAPPGAGERFTRLFEGLYRQLVVIFTARGFHIHEPEFPLIAVVLPDQANFLRYCQKDKVPLKPGLRGYYLPSSNRVALFDATRNGLGDASDVDDTVIHEATHQVAFNLGIHSRMNADPKWVVEGLATVFEREAARLSNRQANVLAA